METYEQVFQCSETTSIVMRSLFGKEIVHSQFYKQEHLATDFHFIVASPRKLSESPELPAVCLATGRIY